MKIDTINIKNYKGIRSLNLELDRNSTVLFGENGTGKSSILNVLTLVYSSFITRLLGKKNSQQNMSVDDITFGEHDASITADILINGQIFQYFRGIRRKGNT